MDVYRKKVPKTYETSGPRGPMISCGYSNYLLDELECMMWKQHHIYNRDIIEKHFELVDKAIKLFNHLDIDYINRCKKAYEEKLKWKP